MYTSCVTDTHSSQSNCYSSIHTAHLYVCKCMYPLGCQCDLQASACCPHILVLHRHYDYGTNQVLPHTVQNSTDVTSAMSQNPPSGTVRTFHHPPCCYTKQSPCITACLQIQCHITGFCNPEVAAFQQVITAHRCTLLHMLAMQSIVVSIAKANTNSCLMRLKCTLHIIAVHSRHAFACEL